MRTIRIGDWNIQFFLSNLDINQGKIYIYIEMNFGNHAQFSNDVVVAISCRSSCSSTNKCR